MRDIVTSEETETSEQVVETLREQAHHVRQKLSSHADGIKTEAARLLDWRRFVESHPVGSATAALALGYLLAPARRSTISVSVKDVPVMQERSTSSPPTEPSEPTRSHGVLTTLGDLALQAAVAYAAKQAMTYFESRTAHEGNQDDNH